MRTCVSMMYACMYVGNVCMPVLGRRMQCFRVRVFMCVCMYVCVRVCMSCMHEGVDVCNVCMHVM